MRMVSGENTMPCRVSSQLADTAGNTVSCDPEPDVGEFDERLCLTNIQIPTISAAKSPITGERRTAMSRPTVSAIATVAINHQNPNPRSRPTVAMKMDFANRNGDLI
jgi:hypothetical protein